MGNFASIAQICFLTCNRTHGWGKFLEIEGCDADASNVASAEGNIILFTDGSSLVFGEENGKISTSSRPAKKGYRYNSSNNTALVAWNGANWEIWRV